MSIRLSMLTGGKPNGADAPDITTTRSQILPRPQPAAAAQAGASGAPELGAAPAAPPVAPVDERAPAEHRELGFTSVIRHLSLRGWLRWIQASECDATLRVRTRDGGNGCIWCDAGKVVDAEWSAVSAGVARVPALSGEAALMDLLRLESGSLSIDFDPVDRPRTIGRSLWRLDDEPRADAAALPVPARTLSRAEYIAGSLVLASLVLLAFAIGRFRASGEEDRALVMEAQRAQQTQALLPPSAPVAQASQELSLIPFSRLEVEPAQAEIWLDRSLIGSGHVDLAPLPGNDVHELRFLATGRAPRSVFFVGAPPAGRVVLEPAAEVSGDAPGGAPGVEGAAGVEGVEGAAPAAAASPRSEAAAPRPSARPSPPRRPAPVPASRVQSAAAAARPAAPPEKAAPGAQPAQVRRIEEPRIRVLD